MYVTADGYDQKGGPKQGFQSTHLGLVSEGMAGFYGSQGLSTRRGTLLLVLVV